MPPGLYDLVNLTCYSKVVRGGKRCYVALWQPSMRESAYRCLECQRNVLQNNHRPFYKQLQVCYWILVETELDLGQQLAVFPEAEEAGSPDPVSSITATSLPLPLLLSAALYRTPYDGERKGLSLAHGWIGSNYQCWVKLDGGCISLHPEITLKGFGERTPKAGYPTRHLVLCVVYTVAGFSIRVIQVIVIGYDIHMDP